MSLDSIGRPLPVNNVPLGIGVEAKDVEPLAQTLLVSRKPLHEKVVARRYHLTLENLSRPPSVVLIFPIHSWARA